MTLLQARGSQALRHRRVLLVTEGTYPFYKGGVSQWCDTLVTGMPEVDFHVLGLVADPHVTTEFQVPENVTSLSILPIWGVRELTETRSDLSARGLTRLRRATNDSAVIDGLLPSFRKAVTSILEDGAASDLGPALHAMHRFFLDHDFDTAMRSRPVWDAFAEITAEALPRLAAERGCDLGALRLGDVTDAMLRLYRYLVPLSTRLPRVDVVHSTSGGLGVLIGVAAKLEQGAPFLLTEHGVYLRERYLEIPAGTTWLSLFTLAFMRRITEVGYLLADQVSPGSQFNGRWATRNGTARLRVRTIYNGVDPATFTPVSRAPGTDPVVVWVGRINQVKDVKTLVRAAAVVHRTDPKIRFRLYGMPPPGDEGYYAECLALQEELGLQQAVTFEGFVPSVEAAFNDGDIAVISSVTEGFPYTVIEAMLCGRPVVGTAVGGIPEALLDDTGIIVMPRDPEALADGILRIAHLSHEEREAMGKRGRDRAASQFSLSQSLDAYRYSYLTLAGGRTGGLREQSGAVVDAPADPEPPAPTTTAADAPEATVDAPEATVDAPETTADAPETTADAPEPTADVPETTADAPETTADVPEAPSPRPVLEGVQRAERLRGIGGRVVTGLAATYFRRATRSNT